VVRREETRLDVLVAHGGEIAADDLKVCVLADVVSSHLKHAEMEVGDRAKGAACDEDDRCSGGIALYGFETVGGESVRG